MKKLILPILFFFLPAFAYGQVPLEIKGGNVKIVQVDKVVIIKEDRTLVTSLPFTVHAPKDQALYFWSYPATVIAIDKGDVLEVTAAPKGDLAISVKAVAPKLDKDGRFIGFITQTGAITFSVGEVKPPDPPKPDPDPPKPDPDPPSPAPIKADGLHVLIVFETADKSIMPRGQFDIIYGMQMRDWLKANCTADPQSFDKKAYWIVDKDEELKALDKKWQDAIQRPRQSVPWIIISNGAKGGYEGPLPATTEETIALIGKYK